MNGEDNSAEKLRQQMRKRQQRKTEPKVPSLSLVKAAVPPHFNTYQFFVGPEHTDSEAGGWADETGGIHRIVRSMLDEGHMPTPKSLICLAGSTPTKADVAPKVVVSQAVGGLPEMAGFCMRIDASKSRASRGTWVTLQVSKDDHEVLTRALMDREDNTGLKQRFNEAMATAYAEAHQEAEAHKPVALIWNDDGLPVLIKLTKTAAILIANTGVAGGGKDTANLSTRQVTGPRGTVSHLTRATKIAEIARSHVNGVVSSVASHGSTSKDVIVKDALNTHVDAHPFSGAWSWMLGTDFASFPVERRSHVGMELMSSLALTLYQPKESNLTGGSHVVFCDDSPGGRESMYVNLSEVQLIHHDRLGPTDQDRTDIRATVGGWTRDLGGSRNNALLENHANKEDGAMEQGAEAWVASGSSVPFESLNRLARSPESDQDLRGIMQDTFSRSFSQFSAGLTVDFNPRDVANARRCVKAMLVKIHMPESEAAKLSPKRLNDLKAGVLTTAQRMFKDSKKKGTSLPSLECVLYVVPDGLLSIPHLTLMSLTHGIDLIRLVMTENQEQLNAMTPYHFRTLHATQKERSQKVQTARKRLDAMVDAIRSQPSEPVLQTWSDALELIRAIFFRGGWGDGKVRMDSTALDSTEKETR
jgi:hypothetical protein